jgi:hypothetical protein
MEKSALTLPQWLGPLIFPVSLVATASGIALVAKSIWQREHTSADGASQSVSTGGSQSRLAGSSALERICVGICAFLGLLGAVALVVNEIRRDPVPHPLSLVLLGLLVLLSAPALMWRSPWRIAAEGVATIALSVVAVLAVFSIGFMFVPLLVAMIWVCIQHLRRDSKQPRSNTTGRVDSLS